MRPWTVSVLLGSAFLVHAQRFEFGGTIGGGVFGATDTDIPAYVNFGLETCALCSGTFSFFGEYNHWEPAGRTQIQRADLIAGGLRIQGGRRVRGFFDIGAAGGWDQFSSGFGSASHGNPGIALGGGAAIPLTGRWYIRPQVRAYLLGGLHAGLSAGIGVGFRF